MKRFAFSYLGKIGFVLCFATCLLLFAAGDVKADSLVLVGGSRNAWLPVADNQWIGLSWTFSAPFYNVNISIPGFSSGGAPGTVWLMNNGLAPSNVLATVPFSQTSGNPFFSGLTLGPGTYYLLLTTPSGMGGMPWLWPTSATIAPNVSLPSFMWTGSGNMQFPPSSGWNSYTYSGSAFAPLDVTGSPVPEPATLILVGTGIAGLLLKRKKPAS